MLEVKPTGLAAYLSRLLGPRNVRTAAVTVNGLRLTRGSRTSTISFREIETITVAAVRRRARIRIRHTAGGAVVSGLKQADAEAFVADLETRRTDWWRQELAQRLPGIRYVHNRLAQLADPSEYMTKSACADLERSAADATAGLPGHWPDTLSRDPDFRMLNAILAFMGSPEDFRTAANKTFIANEFDRSRDYFDRVEARPLTDEQRRAVVTDEDRNLVVAAAGSGKTSVIVAKAGWLVHKGYRHPSELLLLAFAQDARQEMEERVRARLGEEVAGKVAVRTFHSLGMTVIGEAEGKRPTLAKVAEDDKALFDLLKGITSDLANDKRFSKVLGQWFQNYFAPYRSVHEFQSKGDYYNYIRTHEIRSLQGEMLKSFEECEIANFLYLNGIPHAYERSYEHDTATATKRQYQPDFYLPEAGVYIEHFGLDAKGNTAPFVNREEYLQGMEWKRQLHKQHGTALIETFSHERASGKLIVNLTKKLAEHGVTLSPLPPDEVFAVINEQGRITPLTGLLATFLNHFKGAQLSLPDIDRRAGTLGDSGRAKAFLAVFEPIFEHYQEALASSGEIDFHDMISQATDLVEAGRYRSPFGYILVDEFQDISTGRARLLKALLDKTPNSRLFAVGDDWQSIYRFQGSDIAIMREFENRFGASERVDLATTFRCADRIAELATEFVLKNPAQIHKSVRATRKADGPAVHLGLFGDQGIAPLKEALDRIAADAARHDGESSVMLLGRYRHTRPPDIAGLDRQFPGLRIFFRTVHASKGLEADYVVVPGLSSGKYGFPSGITDDPLLNLVLAAPENHPDAEERRLFHVALTRARRQVFLLADADRPSPFVLELIEGSYDVALFGKLPGASVPCPECVKGHLKRRESSRNGRVFYGCSNYPLCEHMVGACPSCRNGLPVSSGNACRCRDCGQTIEVCPECGGWIAARTGKFGRFLGCSNYPACNYTRNNPRRGGNQPGFRQ